MTLARAADLLVRHAGLAPELLGPSVLPPAVARRQRALQLADQSAYVAHLTSRPDELQALVEEVVVPETWFFRGGEVFAELAELVRRRPSVPPFRVLSAPCSTGEEPYSLAIALLEAGVPPQAWSIDAIDISARALETARRGEYPELSFRETPAELRGRYFRQSGKKWALCPSVRHAVHYRQGNLIAPGVLAAEPPFDLIFCRNLFIYLTPDARARALDALDRLLAPEGILSLGHAEPLRPGERNFARFGREGLFLYRREALPSATPGTAPEAPAAHLGAESAGRKCGSKFGTCSPAASSKLAATSSSGSATAGDDHLVRARVHANAGQLADALALCRLCLSHSGPSADVYSLMGIVAQAQHDTTEAVRCFQKALYLEPEHGEALLHLMLLHEQQGQPARASLLRRRLQRARGGES
jgi:chemotaxis protein methyltransferase WspC